MNTIEKHDFVSSSPEDLRRILSRQGFVGISNFLPSSVIKDAFAVINKVSNDLFGKDIAALMQNEDRSLSGEDVHELRRILNHYSSLFDVMNDRELIDRMSWFAGHTVRAHPVNKVRLNVPGLESTHTPWHQDEATWPELRGKDCMVIWATLTPADTGNGMRFVANSGVRHLLEHVEEGQLDLNKFDVDEHSVHYTDGFEIGDSVVFNQFTIHSAAVGHQGSPRLSLDLRFL